MIEIIKCGKSFAICSVCFVFSLLINRPLCHVLQLVFVFANYLGELRVISFKVAKRYMSPGAYSIWLLSHADYAIMICIWNWKQWACPFQWLNCIYGKLNCDNNLQINPHRIQFCCSTSQLSYRSQNSSSRQFWSYFCYRWLQLYFFWNWYSPQFFFANLSLC
jgi:hypothetical protein